MNSYETTKKKVKLKLKHPVKNFIANIFRDVPGCIFEISLFDSNDSSDNPLVSRTFEVGAEKYFDHYLMILDTIINPSESMDLNASIILKSVFGNIACTIPDDPRSIVFSSYIGKFQADTNFPFIFAFRMYQSCEDVEISKDRGVNRFHFDTEAFTPLYVGKTFDTRIIHL